MTKKYSQFIENVLEANGDISNYLDIALTEKDFQKVGTIGEGGDEIKVIDLIAEGFFVKSLIKFCDIFSEESGLIKSSNPILQNGIIILDPLDGSDNFLSNFPYYGTSVSLKINNKTVVGIVYNLVTNKYIYKTPNATNSLVNATLKSNFGLFERAYSAPEIVNLLNQKNIKFRSPGATALSLANSRDYLFFLLAGRAREFDVDAGIYIAKGLNIYQNNNFLLVSKDDKYFGIIKDIIKGY